jgi:hypothetical protein
MGETPEDLIQDPLHENQGIPDKCRYGTDSMKNIPEIMAILP